MQYCPNCDEYIKESDINMKEGVALCRNCGTLSHLSTLCFSSRAPLKTISSPPIGCSITRLNQGVVATASLRSIPHFLCLSAIVLFWNGITATIVLLASAGLYTNLIGPLPGWFPAFILQDSLPKMNDNLMTLTVSLLTCLFVSPFVIFGAIIAKEALLALVGKVEVIIDKPDSYVAIGVRSLTWKRRFDPHQTHGIALGDTSWEETGRPNKLIVLSADRTIKFGSQLQLEQMEWLRVVLKELLLNPSNNRYETLHYQPWIDRPSETEYRSKN